MSQQKVRDTLIDAVKAGLSTMGHLDKTAWPNKKFTPTTDIWFNVYYQPGKPVTTTMGESGEDTLNGFVQIDVNVKTDTGEKLQNEALDYLESLFVPGRNLSFAGQDVTVLSAERAGGMESGAYHKVPISVYFYAKYPRPNLSFLTLLSMEELLDPDSFVFTATALFDYLEYAYGNTHLLDSVATFMAQYS